MKRITLRHRCRAACAGLLVLIACSGSTTVTPPELEECTANLAPGGAGPSVLFIGNSLTYWNDMPSILAELFEQAGEPLFRIDMVAFGNFGLEDHWITGARDRIAEGGWDVVIMQQGPSATEGRPSLLQYSELFATDIRAQGGIPGLYMVWPSLARFFDFDGVSDSYSTAADLVEGYLFPAGEAWRSAWARDASIGLYGSDGFHPSSLGSYLAALVMFEQLTGRNPATLSNTFCVPSAGRVVINGALADLLQASAAEANTLFARTPVP